MRTVDSKSAFQTGAGTQIVQDGNRERITVLAAIGADGSTLSPSRNYQGASGNLQDTWLDKFDTDEHSCFFTSSPSGRANDELGYQWICGVFDRETKAKARQGRDYCLLILDGHRSHVNIKFIEFCNKHRILLAIFRPHSTHRIQPLDASLFSPLAVYYGQEHDHF
jgi:hypothetical protein